MEKNGYITIRIRQITFNKWRKWRAEYIGLSGEIIDQQDFFDLLEKPVFKMPELPEIVKQQ